METKRTQHVFQGVKQDFDANPATVEFNYPCRCNR